MESNQSPERRRKGRLADAGGDRRWSRPPRRVLTCGDVERLRVFIRKNGSGADALRSELVVRLAQECLLRPGEIGALRWSDIDPVHWGLPFWQTRAMHEDRDGFRDSGRGASRE